MGRVRRAQISSQEKAELWTRWKRGESPTDIGCALARDRSAIRYVVAAQGGIPPPTRSRLALRVEEREEISRGLACGDSLRADRPPPRPRPLDRQSGGASPWRPDPLSRSGDGYSRLGPRPPTEAVPARGLSGPAHAGGHETRPRLVAAANCGVASTDLSGRSLSARVARDDLPESVRAESGRAQARAGSPPAPAARNPAAAGGETQPAPRRADHRRRLDPRAPGRGRRPRGPGPLGRRPADGGAPLLHRDARRTPVALRMNGWHVSSVRPKFSPR